MFDPAHAVEKLHELFDVARRVHQPVAVRVADEIAVRTERFFGIEAVVVDVVFQFHWKARLRFAHQGLIG